MNFPPLLGEKKVLVQLDGNKMEENSIGEFHPDFENKIISLVIKDGDFYKNCRKIIIPEIFSSQNNRYLLERISGYVDNYKKHPCIETIKEMVRDSDYRDRGGVIDIVESVNGYNDKDFVKDKLLVRAKWAMINNAISETSDPDTVIEKIREVGNFGVGNNVDFVTLDTGDIVEDSITNPIPTPWKWLNDQFLGGPERQDLAVVLSVISGGKTTTLVNIAYKAIVEGYTVVYLTFEDGQKKIKRRFQQRITNMSFDEMVENRQRAHDKCKRFIEVYGSKCYIRTMASRRDTVRDAAAIIKNLPTKPDMIITDYADRFKPCVNYKDPRHGLREVFEDCKQLAKDFDAVHWSARQVNKTRVGKNVVGTEHAGESWGTMESPDLVIGMGRTLEDEKLGRIMVYTAKVRDHEDHKLHALSVDFSRQTIWDPAYEN